MGGRLKSGFNAKIYKNNAGLVKYRRKGADSLAGRQHTQDEMMRNTRETQLQLIREIKQAR